MLSAKYNALLAETCRKNRGKSQEKSGFFRGTLIFIILFTSSKLCGGITDQVEVDALKAIHRDAGDVFNRLANWVGEDPCGSAWTGVSCETINGTDHVTELRLLNMNLTGTIAPDVGNLTQLIYLDFMWNNITGSIPPEVGNLSKLFLLLLNGNQLSGQLPPELGNLSELNRIQIDQNNISGPVPSTFQFLNKAQHFHMNNNSLNGSIPPELGRLESLVHLLLDNNDLSGELPPELSNISTLLIMQLDNNHFSGSIPSIYSALSKLTKLSLRNCSLTGTIPDLSAMSSLGYLDLSQNQLTGQLPSSISQVVTTIVLSNNRLDGEIPEALYKLENLEFLLLGNNLLDGNVSANELTHTEFSASSVLVLDFQNNNFSNFTSGALLSSPNVTLRLFGNPICDNLSPPASQPNICIAFNGTATNVSVPTTTISTNLTCTTEASCDTSRNEEIVYGLLLDGICRCAYPLNVGYRLKSPGFATFPPYEDGFQYYLSSGLNLSDYQVNISSYGWEPGPRLAMNLKLFPNSSTTQFTDGEVQHLFDTFTTWKIPDNDTFGPYEVLSFIKNFPYNGTATSGTSSGLSGGAIAGIVIGAVVFTALLVAGVMAFLAKRQRRYAAPLRAARRHHERIKVTGVKDFTYEEMAKATKNFEPSMQIGQGGYGKVYRGILADGMVVAIKRAEEGSLQGAREFYTEIELLSRVHHRNLVSLVGYCDDEGEQMLVYEFMENGTLRDHLNSNSKVPLNFPMRIQIALGSAKGILYLHTEANPPIYHRDIKASNILLDAKMRAKVADFGLSKLAPAAEFEGLAGGHVSTVVKGTPGYLDPEYFLTHQLTDKSDVYSFGVVLLELITGMQPISHGKNLVREVNLSYEAGMMLSIVDPRMGPYPAECLQPLSRLAVSCCKDDYESRPSMGEVVRELEAIWRLTPVGDSMTSFETSLDPDSDAKHDKGFTYNNPYISSDIDGSGLMSGTMPNVAPR
ncbi:hypothetical protein GOP47_0027353 [Adiantum capillus-veneris]|nr:hypothetical protein GOP47_0027353 [Adiantum capillus-veneris]